MKEEKYYGRCLLCKEIFKDHVIHCATNCNGTLCIRNKWLKEINTYLQKIHKENWKTQLVNSLLEGKNANKIENKVLKKYKPKCTRFMKDLALLRKEEIKKLIIVKKTMNKQDEKNDGSLLDDKNDVKRIKQDN